MQRKLALRLSLLAAAMLCSATAFAVPNAGVCSFVATMSYPFAYQYGRNAGPDWGVSVLGTLDWENKVANINVVQMNPNGPASTQSQVQISGPFTVTPGPIPQSAQVNIAFTGGGSFVLNALPTGRGMNSSVLLQLGPGPIGSADGGFVAECRL